MSSQLQMPQSVSNSNVSSQYRSGIKITDPVDPEDFSYTMQGHQEPDYSKLNTYDRTSVQIGSICLTFDTSPREVISLSLDEIVSERDDVVSVFSAAHTAG